ncbi:Gfo/Idh/MocA family protein [Nonomuraea sp. NPDC050663]|uniref:Gfo/Idh/MocA family protein n=1 Tax=Nonomuraea sp. NPDC050663 TaxID=3364370 RepID=UPI00378F0514
MKRHAFVGTGSRAQMYLSALLGPYADVGRPVAFCDTNEVRMAYYDRFVPLPHYTPDRYDEVLGLADVVVITSPDHTHADYVSRALRRGVDVIVEKPMTIDAAGVREIGRALDSGTAELTVTFNYRYSPRNSLVKELIPQIGEVTSVTFEWCLDTVHGADYFRRWHRDKAASGGLLVHKATHHFDLVNWWIGDRPEVVFARGGLRFYGSGNARRRGLGERPSRGVVDGDPFSLDLAADDTLRELYQEGEHLDGYIRDRDVFSDGITIEDNLSVVVGYRGGASMAYTLHAHCPWEGYRVAINGTAGRIELDVVERPFVTPSGASARIGAATAASRAGGRSLDPGAAERAASDDGAAPDDGAALDDGALHEAAPDDGAPRRRGSRLLLQRHWEPAVEVPIPQGAGGHGGGDAMLLHDVFRGPGRDPLARHAGFADGAASVLVGVAGNESLRTGRAVRLDEVGLPPA